ncbi:MAG: hypothetical protein ABIE22_00665 [archaeon]
MGTDIPEVMARENCGLIFEEIRESYTRMTGLPAPSNPTQAYREGGHFAGFARRKLEQDGLTAALNPEARAAMSESWNGGYGARSSARPELSV